MTTKMVELTGQDLDLVFGGSVGPVPPGFMEGGADWKDVCAYELVNPGGIGDSCESEKTPAGWANANSAQT